MTDIPKFAFPFRRTPLILPNINLVPNGSFEHDTVGAQAAGWTASMGVVASTFAGSRGTHAILLGSGLTQTDSIAMATGSPVVVGTSYRAVAAFKQIAAAGGDARLQIRWLDAGGATLSTDSGAYGTAGSAGSTGVLTCTANAPTGAVSAKVVMDKGFSTTQYHIDAILFAPASQSTTYVDGDSAGMSWVGTVGNSMSQSPTPERKVIEVEQDSIEHIDACAQMVIRCPIGFRDERPEFGWPFPDFTNIPLDTAPIEDALQQFGHPNATASATEYSDIIDQSIRYMHVVERASVDTRRETE